MAVMYLSAGQQWRCRHRDKTYGQGGGQEGEGGMNWERNMETYILPYVK